MEKGTLYIVATPIGNLDDISFRAINILKTVDLIICEDTRHSLKLLSHYEISKPLSSYHKFNEISKTDKIIQELNEGKNVALISDAGTPGICDPGNIIIKACISKNISVVPIPGSCAFVQSLISSGFSTNNFSFFGFLDINKKNRKIQLEKLKNCNTDLIILYEAPHKLLNTLTDLYNILGNNKICISKEITKIHESHFRTNIQDAINYYSQNPPKGEYVLIIENIKEEKKQYDITNSETQELLKKDYVKLTKDNISLKNISKQLSQKYNLSKNDIYNFLIKD